MNALIRAGAKSVELRAVVLNADGTVKKNLGVVAYAHRNPFVQFWVNAKRGIKSWLL